MVSGWLTGVGLPVNLRDQKAVQNHDACRGGPAPGISRESGRQLGCQTGLPLVQRLTASRHISPHRPPAVMRSGLLETIFMHAALLFASAVPTHAAVANAIANAPNTSLRNVLLRPLRRGNSKFGTRANASLRSGCCVWACAMVLAQGWKRMASGRIEWQRLDTQHIGESQGAVEMREKRAATRRLPF